MKESFPSTWHSQDKLPSYLQDILDENKEIPSDVLFEPNHSITWENKPWYGLFITMTIIALFGLTVAIAEFTRGNTPYSYIGIFLIGTGLSIYFFISTKNKRKNIQYKLDNNLIREGAFLHKDWLLVNHTHTCFYTHRENIIDFEYGSIREQREKGAANMKIINVKLKNDALIEIFREMFSPNPFNLKEWLQSGKLPRTIFERNH